MSRLNGKVAVITGGARGIGAVIAKRFVEEGAKVVLTDILVEEGEKSAHELGENAMFLKHDVTKAVEWENVMKKTEEKFGRLNILVNNAGISLDSPIEEMTEAEYRRVIDINQLSVFLGMKNAIKSMKKSTGGSIINISSVSAFIATPGSVAYDASKFAVRGMTKTAALEFAKYGVRVNSVHPGTIETPMLKNVDEEIIHELVKNIPLSRVAKAEEVANLVLFLASDEASYSTGSEFIIDGGITAK